MVLKTRNIYIILIALALILGGILGWVLNNSVVNQATGTIQVREDSSNYKYINPLLFTEHEESSEYQELKKQIADYISEVKSQNKAEDVSVYFRDLNKSWWIGVNEDAHYTPSSMLKVIIMLGYYKQAEKNSSLLKTKLHYQTDENSIEQFKDHKPLKPGSYSVETLIDKMIIDSDNTASVALFNNDPKSFEEGYNLFRLPPTALADHVDYMSPKSYSAIFRSLFNSTYISRESSEKALELLTKTNFKNGLVAGVPADISVAHKFGQYEPSAAGSAKQQELHDCGIIYMPKQPYFLCVMTKGDDNQLPGVIAGISKVVYEYQVNQK